jgi:hypothetical protein
VVYLSIPFTGKTFPISNDFMEMYAFIDSFGVDIIGTVMHIKGIGHLIVENVTEDEEEIWIICK